MHVIYKLFYKKNNIHDVTWYRKAIFLSQFWTKSIVFCHNTRKHVVMQENTLLIHKKSNLVVIILDNTFLDVCCCVMYCEAWDNTESIAIFSLYGASLLVFFPCGSWIWLHSLGFYWAKYQWAYRDLYLQMGSRWLWERIPSCDSSLLSVSDTNVEGIYIYVEGSIYLLYSTKGYSSLKWRKVFFSFLYESCLFQNF